LTDQGEVTIFSEPIYNDLGGGFHTHTRSFDDGSNIMYYDSGHMFIRCYPAPVTDDPCPVPKSHLYYWQVICNRPDISTWEQIAEAIRSQGIKAGGGD
jgi:hypothetical protein